MKPRQKKLFEYDRRIERAVELAVRYPFARAPLAFYEELVNFQKELYSALVDNRDSQPVTPVDGDLRSELNFGALLPEYPKFLAVVEKRAPGPLAAAAGKTSRQSSPSWMALLNSYWAHGGKDPESGGAPPPMEIDALQEFLARAFLQGYAEFISEKMPEPLLDATPYLCPKCDSLPLLGVLRPEGDGGKRWLRCGFCGYEWAFRRILCPSCGEESEEKLPVYVAEQFPHIRVEGCDTCKRHLRTIDLTKDGNAVAEVDDLAAIPLTLWAEEFGYKRIFPNLLGA
ncbi:MAG TPA: formate dehydrogenase accessory protein FdhE [Candidatus Acidoferrum sp.]|nr:formate dehydrogenase accessory protein FdhE [Candidatus Acidoferrum sp.]